MPVLRLTYSGNVYDAAPAGTVDFPLTTRDGNPVPYLQKQHIHAYTSFDHGLTWTELTRPLQWDFDSTGTIVRLKSGIGTGQQIKVLRATPRETKYTTFQDSSLLTAEQLNESEDFNLYVSQEISDLTGNSWSAVADTITGAQQKAGAWVSDDNHIATTAALSERFDVIMSGTKPPDPPITEQRQGGKFWVDTALLQISYWDPVIRAWINLTDAGPPGPAGGGVAEVTGIAPIQVAAGTTSPVVSIRPATPTLSGSMSAADKAKLDALSAQGLPIASASTLGGIKVGNNLTIDANGVLSGSLPGALVYKGLRDVTQPAPTALSVGHVYINSTTGTADVTWTGLSGSISAGDMLLWDGFAWGRVGVAAGAGSGVIAVTGAAPVKIGGTASVPEVSVDLAVPSSQGVGGSSGLLSPADKEKLDNIAPDASAGTVTNVSGAAPVRVATGTTTPVISVDLATSSAAGVVQLADAAAVTAGTAGRVVDASQLKAVQSGLAGTYQTLAGMSSYLTTAAASSTYQTVAGMNAYALKGIPQNAQTSSYTLVASDNSKHISITTGGVTVPAGVLSVGSTVVIYNNSTSDQTITQGGSVTLRLSGTATTGNRTLAQYGLATLVCVAENTFVITGTGLS